MTKKPAIDSMGLPASAQEVSVGVAIEVIARLQGTTSLIKGYTIDIEPVFEGASKSPSRFNIQVDAAAYDRTSHFIVSSDGAVIASADTKLYSKLHYDPMNGYTPHVTGDSLESPSTLTLSDIFQDIDEFSPEFLNDQIHLVGECAGSEVSINRSKFYLVARAHLLDSPEVLINGVYAFVDTIPALLEGVESRLPDACIHYHAAVALLVQSAETVNQAYVLEALQALEEVASQMSDIADRFIEYAHAIEGHGHVEEARTWLTQYEPCIGYALARIKDHKALREMGEVEKQKMVSSMSNPWRSAHIGEYEKAWEAEILEPFTPFSIEATTLHNAVEVLDVERAIEGMRRKGILVSNAVDAVAHIVGFELGNVVVEVTFKQYVQGSQSFFGLRLNECPLMRKAKSISELSILLDGKSIKVHAAYPQQQLSDGTFRLFLLMPKEIDEQSIRVTYDPFLLAKDPDSAKIRSYGRKVPVISKETPS